MHYCLPIGHLNYKNNMTILGFYGCSCNCNSLVCIWQANNDITSVDETGT